MEPPPRFPFAHPADALDAHLNGTFWPRIRRWAEHLEQWLNTQRPPLHNRPAATQTTPSGQREEPS